MNEGEKGKTRLIPTRRWIAVTQGPHHVIFDGALWMEVAEFLRIREEFNDGCVEWNNEEQQRDAKATKEMNKSTIKFR